MRAMQEVQCRFSWSRWHKGFKLCSAKPPVEPGGLLDDISFQTVLLGLMLSVLGLLIFLETQHQLTKFSRAPPGFV